MEKASRAAPEAAAERKGEALSTERVRMQAKRTLDAFGMTHAPGGGAGVKARRAAAPAPLTTEGDSLPSLARGGGEWLGAVVCPLWGRRFEGGGAGTGEGEARPGAAAG